MDDATSRIRSSNRRMAQAKPAATTKRSSPGRSSKKNDDPEVSPARWAGVALVIAAIFGAIMLAVLSPSDPETESAPGVVAEASSPSPSPTALDTRIPAAKPVITKPLEGVTPEIEIAVTADVPQEEIVPKKLLRLYVLRGDEIIGETLKPKPGTNVSVEGVRLDPGPNKLTVALGGPGGLGPLSDAVVVTLDENAPKLEITSPKNKYETFEDRIRVEGTSEVGAEVRVRNEANDFDQSEIVGSSGEFGITVRLKRNANRIVATSEDNAGQVQDDSVRVIRIDGRPSVKLKHPEEVRLADLPRKLRIVVDVTDAKGKLMEDAEVHFSLGAPDRTSQSEVGITDTDGRAVWNPEVSGSTSTAEALALAVTVISPTDDSRTLDRSIPFR